MMALHHNPEPSIILVQKQDKCKLIRGQNIIFNLVNESSIDNDSHLYSSLQPFNSIIEFILIKYLMD